MMSFALRSLPALAAGIALAACSGSSTPASEPAATPAEETAHAAEPAEPAAPAAESPPDPAGMHAELLAAETSAFEQAEPILRQHCARCHAQGGKKARARSLDHFDMTRYPLGGHHADEITSAIRKVLGIGGGEATMPMDRPGAVKGEELALIAAWADAYDRADAGGAHADRARGGEHEHGEHEHGEQGEHEPDHAHRH